jgi:hypothetical protein
VSATGFDKGAAKLRAAATATASSGVAKSPKASEGQDERFLTVKNVMANAASDHESDWASDDHWGW